MMVGIHRKQNLFDDNIVLAENNVVWTRVREFVQDLIIGKSTWPVS